MTSSGEARAATLTEILILHGLLPIEVLDTLMAGDPADEGAVRQQGMTGLRDDGWAKVRFGLTSIEEILSVVA